MKKNELLPPKKIELKLVENLPNEMSELIFVFPDNPDISFTLRKKLGDVTIIPLTKKKNAYYVSLGDQKKTQMDSYRKAAAAFSRWCISNPVSEVGLDIAQPTLATNKDLVRAVLEGLCIGGFQFNRHKTRNLVELKVTDILIETNTKLNLAKEILHATVLGDSVDLARDWIHEPANIINPQVLEDRTQSLAKEYGLGFKVIQYDDLITMGAGGITAVGRGSQVKPRLIIMEYKGNGSAKPIALVGKAITFDTGGYSLKGAEFIQGMKYDKAGGISVIATVLAAARLKLKVNLIAIVPAAENMISGDSYRPDDILTMLSGLTVEIVSTDAEGRLILADALTYTQNEYKPRTILDIATLTGGVHIALGKERAGLLCNSNDLADVIYKNGEAIGEKVWRLPMDEEYFDLIKSDDADMKNSGPREAQTIVGAMFLKQAVSDEVSWAHIDIASTGENETEKPWCAKGPNGFGVRLMLKTIESLIEKN